MTPLDRAQLHAIARISGLEKFPELEEEEGKTAGLALAIGTEAGLKERSLELFVNFTAARFPNERSEAYIAEWACRFISGSEWLHADRKSRKVLFLLSREMNLNCYPDPYQGFT